MAVDRFEHVAVIHADSANVLEHWREPLAQDLAEFSSAYLKLHPRRVRDRSATAWLASAAAEPLWGRPVEEIDVVEGGTHYLIRPAAGLSVGLFLDMREVRAWVRGVAQGRSVLNLFAYTCSLGVSAMLGGATRVLNLDVSRHALAWGQENYGLNEIEPDPHDFVFGDAFDWLGRFSRRRQQFDLVIVDPPSFSSSPFSVGRDYARLIDAAAKAVAPAGILLAATNHSSTSDERFEAWLDAGLTNARRHGQLVGRWHEPAPDFPVPTGRGPYLKVAALVLD
ncbi:MAG: class I SAM-dependent methyltransferase [Chloroflexi bacterium]|nr:class I SAM-dependent methyltransferase [Chloroflexota bacterium]